MKYYLFDTTVTFDTGKLWVIRFPASCNRYDLNLGKRVRTWNEDVIARCMVQDPCVDFPCVVVQDWDAASPRLQDLLQSHAARDIQLLPFTIHSSGAEKREVPGYALVNYLCKIDCLDRVRSVVKTGAWTDPANPWLPYNHYGDVVLKKVVLEEKKIGDAPLFRFLGGSGTPVMREDLKVAIEEAKVTGIRFEEIETA